MHDKTGLLKFIDKFHGNFHFRVERGCVFCWPNILAQYALLNLHSPGFFFCHDRRQEGSMERQGVFAAAFVAVFGVFGFTGCVDSVCANMTKEYGKKMLLQIITTVTEP